jgi:hypothetical protein
VLLEAGVVKAAPGDELLHGGGPSDLSDYFGGNAAVADALCAAPGG